MIPLLVAAVACALVGPVLMAIAYLAGDMAMFVWGLAGTALGVAGVAFWQRHRRPAPDDRGD